MLDYDVANTSPTWVVDAGAGLLAYSADQAGTTNDPKLVVVHSAAVVGTEIIFNEFV